MSSIEWTDITWNPTTGCDRVSPGCDNCYAMTMAKRLKGMGSAKYQRDGDPRTSGPGFGITEHASALDAPLHWRKPRKVFVNSMSDLFHDGVSDGFIGSVFEVMAKTPQHTYQVLTKRHGRMRSLLNKWAEEGARHDWAGPGTAVFRRADMCWVGPITWPLPNVHLGVSVEDQQRADLRIPALLQTPAAVRFLSCEPLLGPVDLFGVRNGLDWVIAGGESGPGARPMHPQWARHLRDQCQAAGVAYLFKQWGEWGPLPSQDDWRLRRESDWEIRADGYTWPLTESHGAEDGTEMLIRRFGKKDAGRELDGRTWDEYPAVRS